MKKILSIILSITILVSMSLTARANNIVVCPEDTEQPQEVKILKVGINAEYPPFEYYEDDKLTGFDIDLMNYIGEKIGYDIDYVEMSFDKLIPAIVNGEVDCVISAITATDKRRNIIDFSNPYFMVMMVSENAEDIEEFSIAVGKNETELLNSINDAITVAKTDGTVSQIAKKYQLAEVDIDDVNYSLPIIYAPVSSKNTEEGQQSNANEDITSAATVPAPSKWAEESIDFAYAVGITDADKEYIYQNNITREEFCELIYKLTRIVGVDIEDASEEFIDTDNKSVAALFTMGIINGKSATEFAPDDRLTREEAATIIIRMINKVMPMEATEIWFEYDDIDEISKWASGSVQTISNLGFMNGVGNNKFAPKDTYTTEQAIATLVRVYEGAEAAGVIEQISDIEIIGGADGPTSIIVGDNVNVIETEEFEKFYVNVTKNTTEVDDFYINEAIKLVTESGELAADKEFISYYTPDEEITEKISALSTAQYSKPTEIYYMAADREHILANLKAAYRELNFDYESLTEWRFEKLWEKFNFSALASMINASYGSENLAALTILANSRGYIMPKDFKKDFALFLQYDGEYSALVSFSEFGDGVIKATMSFVNNGDKDNIFRRIYEITQGLGDDSIYVASCRGARTTS